jgi:hypothetical protein
MSTKHNEIDEKQYLTTFIKLENDSDDELTNDKKDYYSTLSSTSTITNPALVTAYKGKIEVTSKGRRKIFDGVRWQILCRRPGLFELVTEYESNKSTEIFTASVWQLNLNSFFPC